MTNKIEIRDVTKTFKEGDILKNVSFTAEEGEVTAFLRLMRVMSMVFWDLMVPEKVRHYEYFWVWIGHLQELL